MTTITQDRNLHIGALVHPRMLASSITLPMEIMQAAAQSSRQQGARDVNLRLLSTDGQPLSPTQGMMLATERYEPDECFDVLIVPAIWRNPRWVMRHFSWHISAIAQAAERGCRVCAVGSGSFLLAASGCLNGADATTHWHWFDEFAQQFPTILLRRDQLITQHQKLFCVGSVNSIADLMVYLCSELFSSVVARRVEHQFSPEIRRRFSPHTLNQDSFEHTDEQVLDAQLWLKQRYAEPLDVKALARELGLSSRTVSRRFQAATGTTLTEFQRQQRIEEAKQLLRHSNLSVRDIGGTVGYADPANFAHTFKRNVGVSPREYRTAIRGKVFNMAVLTGTDSD